MAPLFSIITVCYNAADELRRTIASVDEQVCTLYEHIIIDGASTDSTAEVLASCDKTRRVVVSEPDSGIYDAMNKGLSRASGDYVIFMNAGDCFHDAAVLQLYANAIMDNDYPGLVYGQTQIVDSSRHIVGPRHLEAPTSLTLKSFACGMLVCHQAMAVLRRIAPRYNMKYRFSADYEWAIRCLQHSRSNVYVDAIVCDYLQEGATTRNHRASLAERFRIMCRYYGVVPTVVRHFGFAVRDLRRKLNNRKRK